MSNISGQACLVDIAEGIRDHDERNHLVMWGATYLSGSDEDMTIRAGHLTLQYRDAIYRAARARRQKISFWQCNLYALGMLTAAVRLRAELTAPVAGHTLN